MQFNNPVKHFPELVGIPKDVQESLRKHHEPI